MHAIYCMFCFTIGYLCYMYQWVHIVEITILLLFGLWTGAGFYMDYFSKNYEKALALGKPLN
jgi:hypothetical protein